MLFNNYNTLVSHKYLRFIQCIIYTFIYVDNIFCTFCHQFDLLKLSCCWPAQRQFG